MDLAYNAEALKIKSTSNANQLSVPRRTVDVDVNCGHLGGENPWRIQHDKLKPLRDGDEFAGVLPDY